MEFGLFAEQTRRGANQDDAFQEMFALVDAAESWGLDVFWLAEMLVNPARSVLSAPLLVASWIASRTKRLRVGTAVQLLPLNHPLRVAGEVTTLDHLSQGRFDFGIGRSGSPRAYDALGVPYAESQEPVSSRRSRSCSRPGKASPSPTRGISIASSTPRWRRARIGAPIRLSGWAATTPETFPRVARMGLPIFVGLRGMSIPELTEHLGVYRAAWREAGHPGDGDVCLRIPIYAAPTEDAAVEEPRETITYYFQRQADLTRAPLGRAGTGPVERRVAQAERLASLSYDEILTTKVAFGTGPGLVDRLRH
jgi:alkanesulfonate monooxygenase SsuD/methylene tetrahydromethanopterin reductase-like flavin-dependent oxidoreductase (luciferase family)